MAAQDIIREVAARYGISAADMWIPLSISYGESGWDPNNVGDNGKSVGLFMLHENGAGSGMGARRYDPYENANKIMPEIAAAISAGKQSGLSGLNLLKHTWFTAERPANTPQAHQNMERAYQFVTGGGGGNVPDDGFNATIGVDYPSGGIPQNVEIIPGPNGPLGYIIKDANGKVVQTLTPEQYRNLVATGNPTPKTPDTDSPSQTANAAANTISANAAAKNADTSRLNAIVNAIDMKIKAEGIPAEQAMNIFKAEIQKLTLQQNQDISQGDFSLRADDQNLRRTTAMNTDAREREIQEQQRKVDLQRVATDRGISAARDILPSAIPGATSMTLPMLGEMPLPQVNLDQFYSQGLPPLIDQWNNPIASSAPNPWGEPTTAPQLTPLQLPKVPEPAPPVDIDAILKMVRGWI